MTATKSANKQSEVIVQEPETELTAPTVVPPTSSDKPLLLIDQAYEKVYLAGNKVNELNRQLAFAGIAVIWVFKTDSGGRQNVPFELFIPGIFLILSLAFDLIQPLFQSEAVRWYTRRAEKACSNSVTFPRLLGRIVDGLFYLKIVATLVAYIFLIYFLVDRLFNPAVDVSIIP